MGDDFEIVFLGVTGSCAYNGGERAKYGTNTLCVAVRAGTETLVFDAGSGICGFGNLPEFQRDHIHVFFSHHHIDHVSGLLFFPQLFNPKKKFDMYGGGVTEKTFYDLVDSYFRMPLNPVGLDSFQAKIDYHTVNGGQILDISDKVRIKTHDLSHPGGSLGYRVEYGGKAFCYCTDAELSHHQNDAGLLEFTRGADMLVLDSFFHTETVLPGWGHSSWRECAEWAARAGVKRMALFHYGFMLPDAEIDAMEKRAKGIFPGSFASADRMLVKL